jgi:hypothetical protein
MSYFGATLNPPSNGTLAVDEKTHRIYLPSADYAPLPADAKPGQRPAMVPGSFQLMVVGETH